MRVGLGWGHGIPKEGDIVFQVQTTIRHKDKVFLVSFPDLKVNRLGKLVGNLKPNTPSIHTKYTSQDFLSNIMLLRLPLPRWKRQA